LQEVDLKVFFLTFLPPIHHLSVTYLSSACGCHGYERHGLHSTDCWKQQKIS